MRKRSIFLKIYLWFWLTTALILAAQIGLHRLTDSGPPMAFHLQQTLKPVLSVYGHTALQYHLSGNHDALRKWTDELKDDKEKAEAFEAKVEQAEARANRFDLGEALLEIGLVITSVTLLTRRRAYWYLGIVFSVAGIVSAASVLLLK